MASRKWAVLIGTENCERTTPLRFARADEMEASLLQRREKAGESDV